MYLFQFPKYKSQKKYIHGFYEYFPAENSVGKKLFVMRQKKIIYLVAFTLYCHDEAYAINIFRKTQHTYFKSGISTSTLAIYILP